MMTQKNPCKSTVLQITQKHKWLVCAALFTVAFLVFGNKYLNSENRQISEKEWNLDHAMGHEKQSNDLSSFSNTEVEYEILNDTSILPPSARIVPKKIFKDKPLVIWATEWHMTPIKDLKNLLTPFGVTVLDYNLDLWRCEWHDCKAKDRLKVQFNSFLTRLYCSSTARTKFYC